jgi:DNA modification methylase
MLPTESVDLVVTDPPYFVRYRDRMGRTIANDADLTVTSSDQRVVVQSKHR